MTKTLVTLAATVGLAAAVPARAQTNMSCADYLKADSQMQSQMSAADKAALNADPSAAALDKKMRAYCVANPKASAAEAMEKAMN